MRALVTGAQGTLGRPLCRELEKESECWGLDLHHCPHPLHRRADVANYRELREVWEECNPSIVYHLAAEFGRWNGELFYERLWQTNAIGTRNVLELCAEFGTHLVFASSSEIYGEGVHFMLSESLTEECPLFHPNEYALSKWVNEVQIRNFAARNPGMPTPTICRFFNSYGPGEEYHDFRSVVALFCYRALKGIPFEVYEGYSRTFMWLGDFIPTLARAGQGETHGKIYNIGGIDYRSVEELAEIVIEESGCHRDLVQRVGKEAHNVVSKRPNIELARNDLGHNPKVRLEEGVPLTIQWMRERYGD